MILTCSRNISPRESLLMIKITGVSIFIRNPIGAAAVKDIESALMVAMVFGVTSPKISIRNVRIPVAIPAPVFPKRWMPMLRILLVDDEPLVLIGLQGMLEWEKLGYTVCGTARNGKLALELIEREKPDIVIADVKIND